MEYRFLWAELKLKAVKAACLQGSENKIKKAIHNIPMDLTLYYDRIWDGIGQKSSSQRDLATKALIFVAYATEPVSIDVLALAIAVKDHTQSLDMLRCSTAAETILNACDNLLSIDTTDPLIRRVCFIHFSVREYLTNHWSYTFSPEYAHREIARMCIVFLLILYSQVRDHCTHIESSFANDYILPSLPQHLLAGEFNSLPPDDKMVNLASLFFREGPPMLAPPDKSYPTTRIFFTFSQSASALIFNLPVTHQCFDPQVENQLDQSVLTWVHGRGNFVQVPGDRFAMHYATGQLDSVDVCQRLHTHGYPIGYSHHDSNSPLSMVQIWQAQLIPSTCALTPLYLAKSKSVARFLVDNNASVNPQVQNSKLPDLLGHLARDGNTEVIQFLLDSDAEQDTESQSSTLQSLASRGKVEVIQLFLNNGVDVNIQSELFSNMLQAAAYRGHVEVMRILLDHGADVNVQGSSALQATAYRGHVEAMQTLLGREADVNVQGGNALHATAYGGHAEAMKILLDRGADVNAQGGNALQAAAYRGHVEAMQILLDRGADVNLEGGEYGNVLQAAAYGGHVEAMKILLDHGVDVNGKDGIALQAAAYGGHVEVMRILLDREVDVNAQGGGYGNALQAAAYRGHIEAMQILLDRGADVNAQGGIYGTVLQAALAPTSFRFYNHLKNALYTAEILLDYGADPTAHVDKSKYGDASSAGKELWKHDEKNLKRFEKLVEWHTMKDDTADTGKNGP